MSIFNRLPDLYVNRPDPTGFTRFLFVSASAVSGTGSAGNPYTIAQMRANVIGGDAVFLEGDFTGPDSYLRDGGSATGTSDHWIAYLDWSTIDATKTSPIIRGEIGGSTYGCAHVWDASYIAFIGLFLANSNNSSDSICRNADNVQYVACSVFGRGLKLGDAVDGATNCWVDGCTINNIGSYIGNDGDGVFIQNGSSNNHVVRNNVGYCGHMGITDGGFSGIGESTCDDNVIAFNNVTNPWAGALNIQGNSLRPIVEYNNISDSGTSGLGSPGTEDGLVVSCRNGIFRFNTIWNCDTEGIKFEASVFAGVTHTCTGNQVYNNTIYGCGGSAIGMVCRDSLNAKITLANNLIMNNVGWANHRNGASAAGRFYNGAYRMVFIDLFNAGTVWDVNTLGGNFFLNNTLARTAVVDAWSVIIRTGGAGGDLNFTLASFESTFPGCASNTQATDPLFEDASNDNFTPRSTSPLLDTGRFIANIPWSGLGIDRGSIELETTVDLGDALPIIDLFNRANEAALLSPWVNKAFLGTDTNLKLDTNKVAGTTANPAVNTAYYNEVFAATQAVYYDVVTKPANTNACYLMLRLNTPGTAGVDGYIVVIVTVDGGDDLFLIFRINNGALTQLGSNIPHAYVAGQGLGLSSDGANIVLWHKVNGLWAPFFIQADASPIIASGFIAVGGNDTTFRLDNVGGGDLTDDPPSAIGSPEELGRLLQTTL